MAVICFKITRWEEGDARQVKGLVEDGEWGQRGSLHQCLSSCIGLKFSVLKKLVVVSLGCKIMSDFKNYFFHFSCFYIQQRLWAEKSKLLLVCLLNGCPNGGKDSVPRGRQIRRGKAVWCHQRRTVWGRGKPRGDGDSILGRGWDQWQGGAWGMAWERRTALLGAGLRQQLLGPEAKESTWAQMAVEKRSTWKARTSEKSFCPGNVTQHWLEPEPGLLQNSTLVLLWTWCASSQDGPEPGFSWMREITLHPLTPSGSSEWQQGKAPTTLLILRGLTTGPLQMLFPPPGMFFPFLSAGWFSTSFLPDVLLPPD